MEYIVDVAVDDKVRYSVEAESEEAAISKAEELFAFQHGIELEPMWSAVVEQEES